MTGRFDQTGGQEADRANKASGAERQGVVCFLGEGLGSREIAVFINQDEARWGWLARWGWQGVGEGRDGKEGEETVGKKKKKRKEKARDSLTRESLLNNWTSNSQRPSLVHEVHPTLIPVALQFGGSEDVQSHQHLWVLQL